MALKWKFKRNAAAEKVGADPHRRNIILELYQIIPGIVSKDQPTRWMSMLFIVSLIGLISVSSVTLERFLRARAMAKVVAQRKQARTLELLNRKASKLSDVRSTTLTLGTFNVELARNENLPPIPRGVLNTAEIEIVLICDTLETREYLESHIVQAKNQLTDSLTSLDRDELLTRSGKKRLKAKMLKGLNQWLLRGSVKEIYFSSLIIS